MEGNIETVITASSPGLCEKADPVSHDSKPVSSTPACLLLQFLPPSFFPDFPRWQNKPFPSQVAFGYGVYPSSRRLTRHFCSWILQFGPCQLPGSVYFHQILLRRFGALFLQIIIFSPALILLSFKDPNHTHAGLLDIFPQRIHMLVSIFSLLRLCFICIVFIAVSSSPCMSFVIANL